MKIAGIKIVEETLNFPKKRLCHVNKVVKNNFYLKLFSSLVHSKECPTPEKSNYTINQLQILKLSEDLR